MDIGVKLKKVTNANKKKAVYFEQPLLFSRL